MSRGDNIRRLLRYTMSQETEPDRCRLIDEELSTGRLQRWATNEERSSGDDLGGPSGPNPWWEGMRVDGEDLRDGG